MVRKGKDHWVHLKQIIHFVKTDTFLDSVTKEERSGIRKAASNFVVRGSSVYYCGKNDSGDSPVEKRLVIISPEEVRAVLLETHDQGGHQGIQKTQDKIKQQYYWLNITHDVREWVRSCPKCHFHKKKLQTRRPVSHPIKVEGRWEVIVMDLIGPFNITAKMNRYVITMTDLFTKWVVAYPLKDKSGISVATAIVEMIHTYGPPFKIMTNQGRELVNEVNKNVVALFGTKHLVTNIYHPQSNGQDQRTNQTIMAAIGKCCNENQDNWDEVLSSAVYGINSSRQSSTKYSPFYLMYFRNPKGAHIINEIHKSLEDVEGGFEFDNSSTQMQIEDAIGLSVVTEKAVMANLEKAQKRNDNVLCFEEEQKVKTFSFTVSDEVKSRSDREGGRMVDIAQREWLDSTL